VVVDLDFEVSEAAGVLGQLIEPKRLHGIDLLAHLRSDVGEVIDEGPVLD
jgi:hypothetical protein